MYLIRKFDTGKKPYCDHFENPTTAPRHVIPYSHSSVDSDRRRAARLVSLSSNNLVVVSAQSHSVLGPSIEVVGHVDGATGTLGGPHRPELGEGGGADDRRRVVASGGIDVVGASVRVHGPSVLATATGVVVAVGLNHVVLDERVGGPSVDSEVAVAAGVEAAAVVDGSVTCKKVFLG